MGERADTADRGRGIVGVEADREATTVDFTFSPAAFLASTPTMALRARLSG